jgi:hypothetical protein
VCNFSLFCSYALLNLGRESEREEDGKGGKGEERVALRPASAVSASVPPSTCCLRLARAVTAGQATIRRSWSREEREREQRVVYFLPLLRSTCNSHTVTRRPLSPTWLISLPSPCYFLDPLFPSLLFNSTCTVTRAPASTASES